MRKLMVILTVLALLAMTAMAASADSKPMLGITSTAPAAK